MDNVSICLTAGEQSENHAGMQILGNGLSEFGFTIEELTDIKNTLNESNIESKLYRLDKLAFEDDTDAEPAALLIINNGVNKFIKQNSKGMIEELLSFEWDKKYWDRRRSRVLNKKARYNVCFGKKEQSPDYENKKGTIVPYSKVPILNKWRKSLKKFIGDKAKKLEIEGNLYYDNEKCGIGFHGDSERKKVIACSLGSKRPIHWQWYQKSNPVGKRLKFELNDGDMYIMSEKTTGHDWKLKNKKTLRHAAGEKYV